MLNLQNILNTEGQEFLDNLLNKEIIVNEKLNAATLSFQKKISSEMDLNKKLTFFKGSGINRKEITVADRVMTNFYSTGMTYLNNLSKIIIDKIPGNWTFICKYFPNHQPSFINYSVLPKNNLVLSCIITTSGTKIEDVDDLRPWAEMFDIAYQEPVFKGYLSQYQKEKLHEYLKSRTNKDSFARFIITLLNPSLTHSLYQNDGFDSPIDGFIFKFISDDGITKPISAKLIDPYMTNLILRNKSNKGFKDNTDVLLSDFAVFMVGQDLDSIILHNDSEGGRYLELFYRLFNRYIKYKKSQLEDFDVDTNDIVKESINIDFDVNIDEISNETTKKILKENPEYKSIFKTLLGSFKSKKPEDYKSLVMSPGVVRLYNEVVDKINAKIIDKEDENNYSFSSYLGIVHKNHTNEPEVNDIKPETQELEIKDSMGQPLSFADFKKKDEKSKDGKKETKEFKSIEDMIKDLKKDVSSIKDEIKNIKKDEKKSDEDEKKSDENNKNKDDNKDSKRENKKESPDKNIKKHDIKDTQDDKLNNKFNNKGDENNKEDNNGDKTNKENDEKKSSNPLAEL